MSAVYYLVANDTGPDLLVTITDRATGLAVDLTAATAVQLKVRPAGSLITSFTIAPTVEAPATQGKIRIVWGASLTALAAGAYDGEVQLTIATKLVTIFDLLRFQVRADFT